MKLLIVIVAAFLILVGSAAQDIPESDERQEKPEELSGSVIPDDERVQTNFVKVLSAILIRRKAVPPEVKIAVRTMMREVLNNRIEKDGYKSYLLTSMLRVIDSKPEVQLISMLNIMESQSPQESPLAAAARILLNWLQSPDGKKFLDEIVLYVRNFFQKSKTPTSTQAPNSTVEVGTSEKPNIFNNNLNPSVLPADIGDLDTTNNFRRAHLSRSHLPSNLVFRAKRAIKVENELRITDSEKYNEFDQRRRPGRPPQGPPRRPEHSEGRPPHGYPDDRPGYPRPPQQGYPGDHNNRPGHPRPPQQGYPEDRPHNHPRPPNQGYPDDRPHNHPRPPQNGYPDNRPGHPRPPQQGYPEDRPHNRPGHPRPPQQGYPDDHHHHPSGPNHPRPGTDKICIERVPARRPFRTV